jgi:hypothetical protein
VKQQARAGATISPPSPNTRLSLGRHATNAELTMSRALAMAETAKSSDGTASSTSFRTSIADHTALEPSMNRATDSMIAGRETSLYLVTRYRASRAATAPMMSSFTIVTSSPVVLRVHRDVLDGERLAQCAP